MRPTRKFFEDQISALKDDQTEARERFLKDEGAIRAFQKMLENKIYVEGEKEGENEMEIKETAGK